LLWLAAFPVFATAADINDNSNGNTVEDSKNQTNNKTDFDGVFLFNVAHSLVGLVYALTPVRTEFAVVIMRDAPVVLVAILAAEASLLGIAELLSSVSIESISCLLNGASILFI